MVKVQRRKIKQDKGIEDDRRDAIFEWLTREGDKAKVTN